MVMWWFPVALGHKKNLKLVHIPNDLLVSAFAHMYHCLLRHDTYRELEPVLTHLLHTICNIYSTDGGMADIYVYRMAGNFGGEFILAVLRAIHQYFIRQNFTVCYHYYS